MEGLTVRLATSTDRPHLRAAVIELQEYERRLHATRLSGDEIADAYLDWMLSEAASNGAVFVAEVDRAFAGFAAGWVECNASPAETPDSKRYGFVSDVCILPAYRGRRLASRLLDALGAHFRREGVSRMRICTLASNRSARASYERSGFTPYEVFYERMID
jgi:ribosomal protein S18 acetylase RimI-like enzyme